MTLGTVIDWFGPLYSGPLGYVVLGILIFLDRGAFTGVFLPGELFLALGGVYAGRGGLSPLAVVLVGVFAGVLGESLSFWLGRHFGIRIIRHLPFANRFENHLGQARDYFRRNGGRTVFIGRYVSVIGTFLPFAAGMSKMPFRRFLQFDIAAVALWAIAVTLLGYFMNSQVKLVDQILSQFGWALLVLVVLGVGGRILWTRRNQASEWLRSKIKSSSRTG
jgi:membrane-associated protein